MYQRMLVPLDGSAFAAEALPYGRLLAGAFAAEIELFRVLPPAGKSGEGGRQGMDDSGGLGMGMTSDLSAFSAAREQYRRVQAEALSGLEAWAAPLRASGLNVRTALGEGDPAAEIAIEAERVEETLICMTTHGRTGFARWRLGSVTDKTLHLTHRPALVLRCPEDELMGASSVSITRIILPLDGSQLAEQAIPHAAALAKALDVPVDLLQAFERRAVAAGYSGGEMASGGFSVAGYLDSAVERLRLQGVRLVEPMPVEGDAAKAILSASERTEGSIVVMSTHGRSGLNRMVRGSIAAKVVRDSGRPVLVVRPSTS